MTIEEKRQRIEAYCVNHNGLCCDCPLFEIKAIRTGEEACYTTGIFGKINSEIVERNYSILFGSDEENPYWKRISAIAEAQRAKGLSTYGEGLENNPAAILERFRHLEEELVDALQYIEWIKDKLMEGECENNDPN